MQPSMDLKNDATIPRMPKMHFHMPLQANKSHSFPLTMQLSTLTFQIARQTELDIHKKKRHNLPFSFFFCTNPVQLISVSGRERRLSCIF